MTEPGATAMPNQKTANHSRLQVSRSTLVWAMIGTAAVVGIATWAVTVAVARPHTWGIGAWISDFAKSSGLAGVLAVVAALIAFLGLNLQLSHQRRAESNRAWWERFQWASSRALPVDPKHEVFPYNAILRTFEALHESATDIVQQGAIGAVMEIASARNEGHVTTTTSQAADAALGGEVADEVVTADPAAGSGAFLQSVYADLSALRSYVAATAGTPADSPQTRARLLESQVGAALHDSGIPMRPGTARTADPGPDFVVAVGARFVGIEVKYFSEPSRARLAEQSYERLQTYVQGGMAAVLIVSNHGVRLPVAAANKGIHAFQWHGRAEDTARLIQRIHELAGDEGTHD